MTPSWEGVRAAGRVQRHVEILRTIAHHLSSDPKRTDRPQDSAEAETQFWDVLNQLQRTTPRVGLSAPTATFLDHVVALTGRWGSSLFACFDDPNLPPTTNAMEGGFGRFKSTLRRALGAKSTTNSLATNLGAELLVAWHQVRQRGTPQLEKPIDLPEYRKVRDELDRLEQPARDRRSWLRRLPSRLADLLSRWMASD